MSKITIEIDDVFTEEGENLAELIVNRAAFTLLHQETKSVASFRDRVRRIGDEEIRSAVVPVIGEALDAIIQPTDSFGAPKGEPRTFSEAIVEVVKKELSKSSDRYDSRSSSVLQKILHDEVERTIRAELQDAMKQAREEVMLAVKTQGAEVLAETIAKMAKS